MQIGHQIGQRLEKALIADEQEYAARSQLKWRRDSNAWVLLYGRRRMGRVVPGMYDLNLSRAKDRVLAQAVREVTWERATDPRKCPANRGVNRPASPYVRSNPSPLSLSLST